MEELLNKIDNLKKEINKLPVIDNINICYNVIINNKELINKIKKFNLSKDNNLRIEIYKYKEFQEYKKYENVLNLLIIVINKKLNKISFTRSCSNESN